MARPATLSGPIVSVSLDGRGVAWCDGEFAGDKAIVAFAKEAAELHLPLRTFAGDIRADRWTPLGAYAAMASFRPGKALLVQAPPEVTDYLAVTREEGHD